MLAISCPVYCYLLSCLMWIYFYSVCFSYNYVSFYASHMYLWGCLYISIYLHLLIVYLIFCYSMFQVFTVHSVFGIRKNSKCGATCYSFFIMMALSFCCVDVTRLFLGFTSFILDFLRFYEHSLIPFHLR